MRLWGLITTVGIARKYSRITKGPPLANTPANVISYGDWIWQQRAGPHPRRERLVVSVHSGEYRHRSWRPLFPIRLPFDRVDRGDNPLLVRRSIGALHSPDPREGRRQVLRFQLPGMSFNF